MDEFLRTRKQSRDEVLTEPWPIVLPQESVKELSQMFGLNQENPTVWKTYEDKVARFAGHMESLTKDLIGVRMAGKMELEEKIQEITNKRLQKGTRIMYDRAFKSFKTYTQNQPCNNETTGKKNKDVPHRHLHKQRIYSNQHPGDVGRYKI